MNIAILGSTNGTDMQAIIESIEEGTLDVNISVVISNKKDAGILKKAEENNIKAVYIEPDQKTREQYDKEIDNLLNKNDVELVVLIGYMKLMSSFFVQRWKNKVMNIHPSLLPAFAGGMDKNVHKQIIDHGCKVSGASLIFIDEGADTGPIILQKCVPVEEDETVESLRSKVQEAEKEIIVKGIRLFQQGKLKVQGRKVRIG